MAGRGVAQGAELSVPRIKAYSCMSILYTAFILHSSVGLATVGFMYRMSSAALSACTVPCGTAHTNKAGTGRYRYIVLALGE